MTIDRFVPGARQPNQPPPSQGRGQVPYPPPSSQAGRAKKKQKVTDQPSTSGGILPCIPLPNQRGGLLSASADPGWSGGCVLLPGGPSVETQVPAGRQTFAFYRLRADVGEG